MRTIVHIGYHKTGTKLLQTHVFPRLRNCTVLTPATPSFSEFLPLAVHLCEAEDEALDLVSLQRFVECHRKGQTLLISFEDFAARDHGGRTAGRLARSLPDAQVLVCVREQRSIALSTYSQSLRGLGTLTYSQWLDWLTTHHAEFRYDELVERYQRVFGAHRVHVLTYEQLASNPRGFVDDVCQVIDPDAAMFVGGGELPVVNRGMTRPARRVALVANRLLVRGTSLEARFRRAPDPAAVVATIERICDRLVPNASTRPRDHDRILADEFAARYAESNTRLRDLTGLPLRDLGYVVADETASGT